MRLSFIFITAIACSAGVFVTSGTDHGKGALSVGSRVLTVRT
jgi:hypothetical protein